MHRKLTITVSDDIYEGLHRTVGRGRISPFIEELVRPHVVSTSPLDDDYQAMAADRDREADADEWIDALAGETLP